MLGAGTEGDMDAVMATNNDRSHMVEEIRSQYSERRCTDVQQLLSTLSNPIRFRMLCALRAHSFTVGELVDITGSQLSNISQPRRCYLIAPLTNPLVTFFWKMR